MSRTPQGSWWISLTITGSDLEFPAKAAGVILCDNGSNPLVDLFLDSKKDNYKRNRTSQA